MEHNSTEQSNRVGTSTQQTQGVHTQPEQKLPDSGSHTSDLARSNGSNDHEAQTKFADEASPIEQVNDLTMQYTSGHKDMTYSILRKTKFPNAAEEVNKETMFSNLRRIAKQTEHDSAVSVKQTTDQRINRYTTTTKKQTIDQRINRYTTTK